MAQRDTPQRRKIVAGGLDRDTIVLATIATLDAGGLDRFSLRGLAASMDVPVTSLYWHITNRETLLALARDAVAAEVRIPEPDQVGWRESVATYARGLREMVVRHPWVVDTRGTPLPMGQHTAALSEQVFAVLHARGLEGADLVHANSLITSCAVGSAILEATTAAATNSQPATSRTRHVDDLLAEERDSAEQPLFGTWWRDNRDVDLVQLQRDGFDAGLTRILDSLEAELGAR